MKSKNYYSRLLAVVGLMAASLLVGTVTVHAQSRTRDMQPDPERIGRSDLGTPEVNQLRGSNRFVQEGMFYSRTSGRFAVAPARVGAVVRRLPSGVRMLRVDGKAFFGHRGVFYVEVRGGFRVVEPPGSLQRQRIWRPFETAGHPGIMVRGRGVSVRPPGARADRIAAGPGHRNEMRENPRSKRPGRGAALRPAQPNRERDKNAIRNRRTIERPEAGSLRPDEQAGG